MFCMYTCTTTDTYSVYTCVSVCKSPPNFIALCFTALKITALFTDGRFVTTLLSARVRHHFSSSVCSLHVWVTFW